MSENINISENITFNRFIYINFNAKHKIKFCTLRLLWEATCRRCPILHHNLGRCSYMVSLMINAKHKAEIRW